MSLPIVPPQSPNEMAEAALLGLAELTEEVERLRAHLLTLTQIVNQALQREVN